MTKRVLSILAALAALAGACFAVFLAATWNWLACENEGTPRFTGGTTCGSFPETPASTVTQ